MENWNFHPKVSFEDTKFVIAYYLTRTIEVYVLPVCTVWEYVAICGRR